GHSADAIAPERLKTWSNPTNAIVHAMHAGEWGDFHYTIAGIDTNGEAILKGGNQNNMPSALLQTDSMVENTFEEIDSPGEWFLDKDVGNLYYWRQKSTDSKTAIFEGTFLKLLMEIKGAETDPVKNVLIKGLKL